MTTKAEAPAKSPRRVAAVIEELKQLIFSGELKPGDRLNEAALALRMGTSRGPIREAMRVLAGMGLVTAIENRGTFVRQMSVRDMLESYDMRAVIFGFAAQRAAEFLTPERRQHLEDLLTQMEQATIEGAGNRYYELNLQFHDDIVAFSNNRRAVLAYDEYVKELHVFRRRFFDYEAKMRRSNEEHRAIFSAMVAGDGKLARQLAEQHVVTGRQRLLDSLEGNEFS
ncbi:GntR family transcriptional regulator [Bordetella sp. N]|uniref:GntR family transcriptional regulator n=1 Tax=Bordetella sp. N TaxID=1746199 RepID=UPI00070D379D|nr:FCD domain-containing protein [Bordetella sp. N]ALM81668.1 GntR family transcriptional regulator [Bordetella sp. N]